MQRVAVRTLRDEVFDNDNVDTVPLLGNDREPSVNSRDM